LDAAAHLKKPLYVYGDVQSVPIDVLCILWDARNVLEDVPNFPKDVLNCPEEMFRGYWKGAHKLYLWSIGTSMLNAGEIKFLKIVTIQP
jgi:hypothetical protein